MKHINPIDDSIITISAPRREKDRRHEVVATVPGGDEFKLPVRLADRKERTAFIDELCAKYPGIVHRERASIRRQLDALAKENELDVDVHPPHGKVNGRASTSVDFYQGSRIVVTESGNLLDSKFRNKTAASIADKLVGRDASRQARDAVMRRVLERLMREVHKLREMPEPTARPSYETDKPEYEQVDGVGIIWMKPTQGGRIPQRMTNFTARVTASVCRTDGEDEDREIELETVLGGKPRRFTVKATQFDKLEWVRAQFAAQAIVYPGLGIKEHLPTAIQLLSPAQPEKTIYTHTGWRQNGDAFVFLHAGGVIAADEPAAAGVDVGLGQALQRYALPAPPTDAEWLRHCVRQSLKVLRLAPLECTYPAYAAVWRAVLGETYLSCFADGSTQSRKSEFMSLCQRHFGATMHAKNCPGSWSSTTNQLRDMAFKVKDAVFLIDDFKPGLLRGRAADALHDKADDMLREQANGSARGRCNDRGDSRVDKRPRGLIFATGEEPPRNESLRARIVFSKFGTRDIDDATLAACQKDAKAGVFAAAMAGYIQWLAKDGRIGKIQGEGHAALQDEVDAQRNVAIAARNVDQDSDDDRYLRTCDNVASLQVGFRHFAHFAAAVGATTDDEAKRLEAECWATLVGPTFDVQVWYQRQQEPTAQFLQRLKASLQSGVAYVSGMDGREPCSDAAINLACGYRNRGNGIWEPGRLCIGRVGDAGVLMNVDTSWRVANEMIGATGDGIGVSSAAALGKRLAQKGVLLNVTPADEDKHGRLTTRRRFDGEPPKAHWLLAHDALEIPWPRAVDHDLRAHARTAPRPVDLADQSFDFESEPGAR